MGKFSVRMLTTVTQGTPPAHCPVHCFERLGPCAVFAHPLGIYLWLLPTSFLLLGCWGWLGGLVSGCISLVSNTALVSALSDPSIQHPGSPLLWVGGIKLSQTTAISAFQVLIVHVER